MEEKIVSRPPSANLLGKFSTKNSHPSSMNGSTKHSTNGTNGSSGAGHHVTKIHNVPIKLSKESQTKFIKALRAKGGDSLSGNAIELFSAESGGDTSLLEALKVFTNHRITKCSFVFPEQVIHYILLFYYSAPKTNYYFLFISEI